MGRDTFPGMPSLEPELSSELPPEVLLPEPPELPPEEPPELLAELLAEFPEPPELLVAPSVPVSRVVPPSEGEELEWVLDKQATAACKKASAGRMARERCIDYSPSGRRREASIEEANNTHRTQGCRVARSASRPTSGDDRPTWGSG